MAAAKHPLSKRLKQARIARGFSQKGLGIAAGIDEFSASARMNQYETGKHIPDFSILRQIAKCLSVPTAYFYAEDQNLADILFIYNNLEKSAHPKLLTWCEKHQK